MICTANTVMIGRAAVVDVSGIKGGLLARRLWRLEHRSLSAFGRAIQGALLRDGDGVISLSDDALESARPVGLCIEKDEAEEDDRCWDTVALLRQVADAADDNGQLFTDAADALADWQGGKVLWVMSETDDFGTMYGLAPDLSRDRPNMQIAIDQKAGDFIMTSFHEVLHLESMMGLGHPQEFRQRCRAGYNALPSVLQSSTSPIGAVAHALPGKPWAGEFEVSFRYVDIWVCFDDPCDETQTWIGTIESPRLRVVIPEPGS